MAKKIMKRIKKITIDIPDEPELHEDTEIAVLLVAAKAEDGPVTIFGDVEDADHNHDDGVDSSRLNQPENKRLNLPHDG